MRSLLAAAAGSGVGDPRPPRLLRQVLRMRGVVQPARASRQEAGREVERADRDVRRLRGVRFSYVPHARERMEEFGISESEVRLTVGQPEEEGDANLGRRYAQKQIGRRRIRVIYNRGAGEAVVVTVMLRRTEGGGS